MGEMFESRINILVVGVCRASMLENVLAAANPENPSAVEELYKSFILINRDGFRATRLEKGGKISGSGNYKLGFIDTAVLRNKCWFEIFFRKRV